ncbi:MAG: DUF2764 family protein [Candidatus Omnitrophota bacterium]|nr:DUF2764 family protein [Candidatus Omnitrophota bacterium]
MPSYHTYLISSLPMLHFSIKPPFSFGRFMEICQDLIPEEELTVLKKSSLVEEAIPKNFHPTLKRWHAFDVALRNELVKIRAGRKHIEPAKYLRQDGFVEPAVSHLAMNAARNPSLLEAERMLDLERWRMLDELAAGHYFDLDFLIVYARKLLILERWERIRSADKAKALEAVLQKDNKN